jgi:hypothetical protein
MVVRAVYRYRKYGQFMSATKGVSQCNGCGAILSLSYQKGTRDA